MPDFVAFRKLMKGGSAKAHGWKLVEIDSEKFRINVDINESEVTLWATNLKTMQ
jgi:hypothetical protein